MPDPLPKWIPAHSENRIFAIHTDEPLVVAEYDAHATAHFLEPGELTDDWREAIRKQGEAAGMKPESVYKGTGEGIPEWFLGAVGEREFVFHSVVPRFIAEVLSPTLLDMAWFNDPADAAESARFLEEAHDYWEGREAR